MREPAEDRADPARREAIILVVSALLLTVLHYRARQPWLGPRYELFGWIAVNVALLLIVPLIVIRLVLRERLADFGLAIGRASVWGRDLAILTAIILPLAALASRLPSIQAYYPRYKYALAEPWLLIPSTLAFGAYFFAWELFFRGFLMMGLSRRLGAAAVFVQLIPFVMAHYQKAEIEAYAAALGGLLLGFMALRGRSILGPWLLHWIVATSINVFVVFWPAAPGVR